MFSRRAILPFFSFTATLDVRWTWGWSNRPASCSLAAPSAKNITTWSRMCCSVAALTVLPALLNFFVFGCDYLTVQKRQAADAAQAAVWSALRLGLRRCARTRLETVVPRHAA